MVPKATAFFFVSQFFFYFLTKQNTSILFGREQIYTAKKIQVLFVAKVQGLERTLFSEGTSSFLDLNVEPNFEALLPLVQKLLEMCQNPWKEIFGIKNAPVE